MVKFGILKSMECISNKLIVDHFADVFDRLDYMEREGRVKRHIAKLQNIRYVGHGYSGHWEVV